MAQKYAKQDVYDFIIKKKNEVIAAKTKDLNQKRSELREKYISEVVDEKMLEDLIFKIDIIKEKLNNISYELDYSSYSINGLINHIASLNTVEKLRSAVANGIDFKNKSDYSELTYTIDSLSSDITKEFKKISAMARAEKKADDVVKKLKELGFNIDDIPKIKRETTDLQVLKIDSDLLGLPEEEK